MMCEEKSLIIDAGGSSLDAYAYDKKRLRLLESVSGNFNIISSHASTLLDEVKRIHSTHTFTRNIILGIAGLQLKEDFEMLKAHLTPYFEKLTIMADYDLWFRLKFGAKAKIGTLAILGTGSIFFTRQEKETYKIGGYGNVIGDPGSGLTIGKKALLSFLMMLDGVKQDPLFFSHMKKIFPDGKQDVLKAIHKKKIPVQHFAKDIMLLAEHGSTQAINIIEEEVSNVKKCLGLLKQKALRKSLSPIAFAGGLVSEESIYLKKLSRIAEDLA